MDDWLMVAVALLCVAVLLTLKEMMMDQLKAQVDATLNVMADAVDTLRLHVEALGSTEHPTSADELVGIAARLKVGTDSLAAAIAQAKQALVA
jgi:hypothetical protein